jgi:hypothetical protein
MNSKEVEKDLLRIEEIDVTTFCNKWHRAIIPFSHEPGSEYEKVMQERAQITAKYANIMEGIDYDGPYDGASPIQDFLRVIIRTLKETEK